MICSSHCSSDGDLLLDRALVTGFVGGFHVEQEEVAVGERRERGVALRGVVVVEARGRAGNVDDLDAGEHAEAAYEVDGRRQPARHAVPSGEVGQLGADALTPQPDLGRDRADLRGGVAHDRLRGVHQFDEPRRRRARWA